MTGKIFIENYEGINNSPERYRKWEDLGLYKNLNTVMIIPTRGVCSTRVAMSWRNLMAPPNSALCPMVVEGFEVGKAYNEAISAIFSNAQLNKFEYILTLEEDNSPPADGLLRLFKAIQGFDVVSGLYHLKGEGQPPQIWGDPKIPEDFRPQPVVQDTVQECNGTGMGFTLYRKDIFKNPGFEYGQWFKTVSEGGKMLTQDLYFAINAKKLGYKFAVDTSCKVGHFDINTGIFW